MAKFAFLRPMVATAVKVAAPGLAVVAGLAVAGSLTPRAGIIGAFAWVAFDMIGGFT